MDTNVTGTLALDIEESSLLYVRLKREEDNLKLTERDLLRKIEGFLYGYLSIEELETLVGDGKAGRW
jgi:hypothetical protein